MFHDIIDKEVEISFHIIDSPIRSFCVVCHTKPHLPVHVLLGLHHCIRMPNLYQIEKTVVENSHLNNQKTFEIAF